jgi:Zn-dependent protease with chaperone function
MAAPVPPKTAAPETAVTAQGHAYAAHASQRVAAQLLCRGDWAEIHAQDGAILARAPRALVQFAPPLGTAPRKVTFPDGALFETQDSAAIDAMTGQTRGNLLHRYEAFGPRLIGVVAFCALAGFALWRYGLDILAALAIAVTPLAVLAQIDRGTLQVLDTTMAQPSELPRPQQAQVQQVFDKMVAALPRDAAQDHRFSLLFRSVPNLGPNAFALPGGTVVITDEFVTRFPQADILAGVIGHEIGHVVAQDGLYRLYRSLGMAVLVAFLAGDVGPILEDILLEGNLLLSLSHSRQQEAAADRFGVLLADQAGYDPAGLARFFTRIAAEYGTGEGMEWLSSHPLSEKRVIEIENFARELPPR